MVNYSGIPNNLKTEPDTLPVDQCKRAGHFKTNNMAQETNKYVMNETLDYTNTSIFKIKTAGGFLYRLWFLISAPIIWLIKGEIKIK